MHARPNNHSLVKDIRITDEVLDYIAQRGSDFRISTSCGGPILLPVSIKPPKPTDLQLPAGDHVIFVSIHQARYLSAVHRGWSLSSWTIWTMHLIPDAMSFEELEHTADIRVRVKAGSLEDLFSEAARALMVIMYGVADPGILRRHVEVEGRDIISLMHAFLSEVLFVSEVDDLVVSGAEVRLSGTGLEGDLFGEPFSREKHLSGMEVKGISFSGLSIASGNHTYTLEVTFDV